MIHKLIFDILVHQAGLTDEPDLDRLWDTVTEMVSPSTIASSQRIEKGVAKCYAARTELTRRLTRAEAAAAGLSRPPDEIIDTVMTPPRIKRQEDLMPHHLEPYGLRAARRLAVELDISEFWITDLRARMSRERRAEKKRAASEQRKARIASVG